MIGANPKVKLKRLDFLRQFASRRRRVYKNVLLTILCVRNGTGSNHELQF